MRFYLFVCNWNTRSWIHEFFSFTHFCYCSWEEESSNLGNAFLMHLLLLVCVLQGGFHRKKICLKYPPPPLHKVVVLLSVLYSFIHDDVTQVSNVPKCNNAIMSLYRVWSFHSIFPFQIFLHSRSCTESISFPILSNPASMQLHWIPSRLKKKIDQ